MGSEKVGDRDKRREGQQPQNNNKKKPNKAESSTKQRAATTVASAPASTKFTPAPACCSDHHVAQGTPWAGGTPQPEVDPQRDTAPGQTLIRRGQGSK